MLDQKHDQLPIFGTGSQYPAEQWKAWVNELVAQGFLTREPGLYPVIKLNERSVEIVDGLVKVQLSRPIEVKAAEAKPAEVKSDDVQASGGAPASYDVKLYETLRSWRNRLAEEQQNPPYVILTNGDIKKICSLYPRSVEELMTIKGIARRKADNYGEAIISMVADHMSDNGIVPGTAITEAPQGEEESAAGESGPWGSDPFEAAYNMQVYIESLQEDLKKTKVDLEALYEQIAASGKSESGEYRFSSEEKYRRSIDQALFCRRYPDIFLSNARITLSSAQKEITPEALEPFILKEAHTSYKVEKKSRDAADLEKS